MKSKHRSSIFYENLVAKSRCVSLKCVPDFGNLIQKKEGVGEKGVQEGGGGGEEWEGEGEERERNRKRKKEWIN